MAIYQTEFREVTVDTHQGPLRVEFLVKSWFERHPCGDGYAEEPMSEVSGEKYFLNGQPKTYLELTQLLGIQEADYYTEKAIRGV